MVWADYAALRRDFPSLRSLSPSSIDSWIIEHFAYVSEMQATVNGIRSQFDFKETGSGVGARPIKSRIFFHPNAYFRAAVAETGSGLVDLKGTGLSHATMVKAEVRAYESAMKIRDEHERQLALDQLRTKDHSDGLMSLGEAIAEVTRQRAVQLAFDLANAENGTDEQTVESYFIIATPGVILKDGTRSDTAAIYGRQAHWRGANRTHNPTSIYADDFGLFQASLFGSAVDFGGVTIEVPELKSRFGDSSQWYRYNKDRRREIRDAQLSQAWRYAFETANYANQQMKRDPKGARTAVEAHIREMSSPLTDRLAQVKPELNERDLLSRELIARFETAQAHSEKYLISQSGAAGWIRAYYSLPLKYRLRVRDGVREIDYVRMNFWESYKSYAPRVAPEITLCRDVFAPRAQP